MNVQAGFSGKISADHVTALGHKYLFLFRLSIVFAKTSFMKQFQSFAMNCVLLFKKDRFINQLNGLKQERMLDR